MHVSGNHQTKHNMAFMLTQHWGELKVCDSFRSRCEEHYKSEEESNLDSKSWPLHDPKTISRKHPFNSQWFFWETAYLPICLYILCWILWKRNCSKAHREVLFYTMYFIFINLCNIFSNMDYWSLSLDTRNFPSVAMYRAWRLWCTLWGDITYFLLCQRKLRNKR